MSRDPGHLRLDRRRFLAAGASSALGLALGRLAWAAPPDGAAKACVLLWLRGGPSQLETFDPKPGAPTGGPTRAIETAVRGLRFAEHLPGLARRADRLAVVRSLTSREGDHERASYLLHTGFAPSSTIRHPTLGSVVASELPGRDDAPRFVCLGPERVGPGYRGVSQAAYEVGGEGGRLLDRRGGPDDARLERRRALLGDLEEPFARRVGLRPPRGQDEGSARTEAYARAARMLDGPLRGALDLEDGPARVREAYGRTAFGDRVLAARRLVAAGVPMVEVVLDGWDDHERIFERAPGRCRDLDRAAAALLDELEGRDLLDRTLVVCMGEFGRTPDVNARGGRDHYPRAFSAVLAGGGLPAGRVVGATTDDGREVAERPVAVADLFATIVARLGVDPDGQRWAGDRPIGITDAGRPLPELTG